MEVKHGLDANTARSSMIGRASTLLLALMEATFLVLEPRLCIDVVVLCASSLDLAFLATRVLIAAHNQWLLSAVAVQSGCGKTVQA